MRGKFKNYIFGCAHAPMEEKSERENDQFHEQLERMYKLCPSYDIKIILGDMNAKMGKEILTGIAVNTCSLYDEHNDNRTHLINYAVCQHMVTGKHYTHIEKYIREHGMEHIRTVNQSDHVMVD